MRIIFFGTSNFGLPALKLLIEQHTVVAVVTVPDSLQGRDKILTPSPIKVYAQQNGITVFQPKSLRNNPDFINELTKLAPDIGIVVDYGRIIPNEVIDLPLHKILNIHPSLLPKYRGPSPLQYALLHGDITTGVSIMIIDSQIDHGPLLAQREYHINPHDNLSNLSETLASMGSSLLAEVLPAYTSGTLIPQPQDDSQATFTKILNTEDARIDEHDTTLTAFNKIRALNPIPGCYILISLKNQSTRIKLLSATSYSLAEINHPLLGFFLIDSRLALQLKDGYVLVETLQMDGKKPVSSADFINGHKNLFTS